MSRRVSTAALVRHHLRSHAGGGAIVGVLVLVLSLLATAAPLALGQLGDATVRDRLDPLPATASDVTAESSGYPTMSQEIVTEPQTTERVWGRFEGALAAERDDAEATFAAVTDPARMIARNADNPLWESSAPDAVTFAFDPRYEDEIRIVDGRLPDAAASLLPDPVISGLAGRPVLNRVEVVMSTDSAAELEWPVGGIRTIGGIDSAVEVALVGIFEAADPESPYWDHATSVLQPNVYDDGNLPRRVTGTGYAHPASLVARGLAGNASTLVWYPVDTDAIDAANAERVVAALNAFTAVSHTVGASAEGVGILGLRFEADITGEIEAALAQQRSTAGVIAMLVAGPIGVAAAVLVLGCRLILEGRRSSLRLLSARGAATGQLRGILGAEGVLWGVLPALVGTAGAIAGGMLLLDAPIAAGAVVGGVLIGLAPVAILVVLAPTVADRQVRADLGRRGSRLRLIAEGVIVALAAVALTLLFVRGYADGVDLLLAATPLLLAVVACLLTLRLYPLPLRAVFARARGGVALDDFVGSARALREPSIGLTPVLALVVGVSVAVSSGVLLSALQTGVTDASRAQIGSDLRVAGGLFTRDQLERVGDVDGVALATGISGAEPDALDIDGVDRGTSVFVVDAEALRRVQGDGPGLLPTGASLESDAGERMPIIASDATAAEIGDADDLRLGGVDAQVVGISRGPVPIGARENWVAIDVSHAEEVLGSDPTDRTILVRLDEDASRGAVEVGLREVLGDGVRVDAASDISARIESGPAVQGVRWALLLATGVAALLSALAVVMTLTLAAAPRARVLALLRTLGAPSRSSTALAAWEIGPPAVAAVVAGTFFGALVPVVVMAAVDLRPFTGSSVAPAYVVDPAILALTLGGFVVVAVLLTVLALFVSRRVRAAGALRTVEEG